MTTYFVVATDKTLLPPPLRNHQELANVAALAEPDVISFYTDNPAYFLYTSQLGLQGFIDASVGVGEDITNQSAPASAVVPQVRVFLRGYKVDASHADVDPNLKLALKRAIAEVIEWRLNQWTAIEPGVAMSSSSGGEMRTRTFRPNAEDKYPSDWMRWLTPYDTRQTLWGW